MTSSLCAETIGATWEVRSENNMERVRAMIAPPSYLYEVSSARAPEGFHSVKEEPQRKDFQVDFPFENPTGYKKPTAKEKEGRRAGHFPSFFSLFYTYGEIRENGPFMIILHPTNNLITRILLVKNKWNY